MQNVYDEHSVIEIAVEAGTILVENGAEIFRVEDTMRRICTHYGVTDEEIYVLVNGLFMAGSVSDKQEKQKENHFATVKNIPNRSVQLGKIVEVNQLSREIELGRYTVTEAREELERIRKAKGKSRISQLLAAGVGSACFCCLLGGTEYDSMIAFCAGFVLYTFFLWTGKCRLSKITCYLGSSAISTLVCLICFQMGLGNNLKYMVIGGIMPLIPGVVFVNGIRDLAEGNHLSGAVRLLEASIVFLCIAIGIGSVFLVYQKIFGGVII